MDLHGHGQAEPQLEPVGEPGISSDVRPTLSIGIGASNSSDGDRTWSSDGGLSGGEYQGDSEGSNNRLAVSVGSWGLRCGVERLVVT